MQKILKIRLEELRNYCVNAFLHAGVDQQSAVDLTGILIENEMNGYPSHGVMRIFDYLKDIENGTVDNDALPLREVISQFSAEITGNKSLGIKVINALKSVVEEISSNIPLHFITIKNAHHLGRLATMAKIMTDQGFICFGFANFNGMGQKVAPVGGSVGLLATNPVVYGIPSQSGEIILDMTTSVSSEGAVRQHYIKEESVPDGWLVGRDGKPVTDPSFFYKDPMAAFLRPLGSEVAGHKGFGLALIAEILSSIRPGTGNISKPYDFGGNSLFFILFKPEILGISLGDLSEHVNDICSYLKKGHDNIHIPGQRHNRDDDFVEIPQLVWERLNRDHTNEFHIKGAF